MHLITQMTQAGLKQGAQSGITAKQVKATIFGGPIVHKHSPLHRGSVQSCIDCCQMVDRGRHLIMLEPCRQTHMPPAGQQAHQMPGAQPGALTGPSDPQHVGAVICALMQGYLDANLADSAQVTIWLSAPFDLRLIPWCLLCFNPWHRQTADSRESIWQAGHSSFVVIDIA